MRRSLTDLSGGVVRPDGTLIDQGGQPTGLHVNPGGYIIVDMSGQMVGTLSMAGRVYDGAGNLMSQVERRDAPSPAYAS